MLEAKLSVRGVDLPVYHCSPVSANSQNEAEKAIGGAWQKEDEASFASPNAPRLLY